MTGSKSVKLNNLEERVEIVQGNLKQAVNILVEQAFSGSEQSTLYVPSKKGRLVQIPSWH